MNKVDSVYPSSFKAAVALAALHGDQSPEELAKRYSVSLSLINEWSNLLAQNAHTVFAQQINKSAIDSDIFDQGELARIIAENSTQGMAMMDCNGYCVYANKAWLDMTGYSAQEIVSKPLHYLVHHRHPDGRPYPMEQCPIDRALPENFDVRAHEDVFFRKDNTSFDVVCAASPIFDGSKPIATVIEIRDVTELKKQAQLRHESEQRAIESARSAEERQRQLNVFLDAAPIGIGMANLNGKLTLVNRANREIWGENMLLAEGIQQYKEYKGWWADGASQHGEPLRPEEWALARALGGADVDDDIVEIEPFDQPGIRKTISLSARPIRNSEGEVTGGVVTQTDITRRQELLSGMTEGLCILNRDFIVLEMNAAAARINQRPLVEMIGRSHWELWPGSEAAAIGQFYKQSMADRAAMRMENCWASPSGEDCWYEVTTQPIVAGLAIYFRDITKNKRAEQEIIQSAARYRILSESVSEIIWQTDATGKIVHKLPSWERYSGQTYAEYSSEGWIKTIHPHDRAESYTKWLDAIATGTEYRIAHRLRRHDGEYRNMQTRGIPLRDTEGDIIEWVGNCQDVTEAILAQEALRSADRHKDEFLAVVGHELRTPLAATRMAAEFLTAPNITVQRAAQMGQVIGRQVGHMSRLVEDLIDVSRVSEGLVKLDRQPIDLRDVLRDAIEQVRPMVKAKGHQLTVESADESCLVYGDATRLVQVAGNLLSNAARYTPADGRIAVSIRAGADTISLQIIDNGIGIESTQIDRLFGLYAQAERSSNRKDGGLGLGLALVKSLVELHGGSVTAMSDGIELGSTFTVTLPRYGIEFGELHGSMNTEESGIGASRSSYEP